MVVAPANPWAKLAGSFAATVGAVIVASVSDNTITSDELVIIVGQVLSFAAVGLTDNRTTEPVRPAG
jgi:hypothetical protein